MNEIDSKDAVILAFAEKLYICSRLLTRAAERLGWDDLVVRTLMQELRDSVDGGLRDAGIEKVERIDSILEV